MLKEVLKVRFDCCQASKRLVEVWRVPFDYRQAYRRLVQCSKRREQNFQFWKLLAVVLDANIKSVEVHKRSVHHSFYVLQFRGSIGEFRGSITSVSYTCYASPKLIKCHVTPP